MTSEPDDVITAADLLFGSTRDAHEALARHVMSARTMARAFARLPRVTREAAVHEAAVAAVGLLKVDLMEVLVTGWREHRDIFSAARRTLDMPGSKELVGLAPHRITTVQQPAVSILVDGHRVHTLQLGLSIFFEVTGLVAGIHAGRLAAIHAGRGDVGVALTVHELEVLTKRSHLELPGVKSLKRGFRLLPASEYPDKSPAYSGRPAPWRPVPGRPVPGRPAAGYRATGRRAGGRPLPRRRPHGRRRSGPRPQRGQVGLRRVRRCRADSRRTDPRQAVRPLVGEVPDPGRPAPPSPIRPDPAPPIPADPWSSGAGAAESLVHSVTPDPGPALPFIRHECRVHVVPAA